ncbi:MAG: hypothetical protein HY319_29355, partial [Armatimonadetes bacterium]|nr:hypothetical protein [Armatimonadota bacterium]
GLLIQLVPTPMGVGMFGETGDWEMTWERAREELADPARLASDHERRIEILRQTWPGR